MSRSTAVRNVVIPVVCLGLTALGLRNVYGDVTAVEREAETVACGEVGCSAQQVEERRSPFSSYFRYQLSRESMRAAAVECQREYIFLGDYQCQLK
jgi:hypothetical protein